MSQLQLQQPLPQQQQQRWQQQCAQQQPQQRQQHPLWDLGGVQGAAGAARGPRRRGGSHQTRRERRQPSAPQAQGACWQKPLQAVLPGHRGTVLRTNAGQLLASVPSAGQMLDEPVLQVGQALAQAAGDLPAAILADKDLLAGVASQAFAQAQAAVAPDTFSGCTFLHRDQPKQLSLRLSIAATVGAQAQAARLLRQGSITVDLGAAGRPCPLAIPVDAHHVLATPFDVTLVFSQFPGSFACAGVTAAVLEAAGIPVTDDPNDLAGAYVVAELAGEPLGPGGTCLASVPDTSRVVAHVRAPAADPYLAQLPRGFQFNDATTRIQVKSLYAPPAAPPATPELEAQVRDLQARVAALEAALQAALVPTPAQRSGHTSSGAAEVPPVDGQDVPMAAAEDSELTLAAAAQAEGTAHPAVEPPAAGPLGAQLLFSMSAPAGSADQGQAKSPLGGSQAAPAHMLGVAGPTEAAGPPQGPGASPAPAVAAGRLTARADSEMPCTSAAAPDTGTGAVAGVGTAQGTVGCGCGPPARLPGSQPPATPPDLGPPLPPPHPRQPGWAATGVLGGPEQPAGLTSPASASQPCLATPQPCSRAVQVPGNPPLGHAPPGRTGDHSGVSVVGDALDPLALGAAASGHPLPVQPRVAVLGTVRHTAAGAPAQQPSLAPASGPEPRRRAPRASNPAASPADRSHWWRSHPGLGADPLPSPTQPSSEPAPSPPQPPDLPHAAQSGAPGPRTNATLDRVLTQVRARQELLGSVTPRAGIGFRAPRCPSPAAPGTPRPTAAHPTPSPPDTGSGQPPPARAPRGLSIAAAAGPACTHPPPSGNTAPSPAHAACHTATAQAAPTAGPHASPPLPPACQPPPPAPRGAAGGLTTPAAGSGTASPPLPPLPRGVKRRLPADTPEQPPRPCPAVRFELSTQHLDRLVAADADGRAGRDQPRHRAQHQQGLRALRAGYRDALMDVLQVAPGPLQVVVNGRRAVGEPGFHPHPLAARAAPRTVLLAIFGSLTASMPPPEDVDPRPVAEAFWKAAREQYDRHLAPAPRQRQRSPTAGTGPHPAPRPQQRSPAARTGQRPARGRIFPPTTDTSPAAKRKATRRRRARNQQGAGGVPQ